MVLANGFSDVELAAWHNVLHSGTVYTSTWRTKETELKSYYVWSMHHYRWIKQHDNDKKTTVLQTIKQLKKYKKRDREYWTPMYSTLIWQAKEDTHTKKYIIIQKIQTIRMIHANKENERGIVPLFGNWIPIETPNEFFITISRATTSITHNALCNEERESSITVRYMKRGREYRKSD